MLRKFSYIIISALFLVLTIGLAVSKHYCCGNLISVSFFSEAESCCDNDNCCKNDSQLFQLDEDCPIITTVQLPSLTRIQLLSFELFVLTYNKTVLTENNNISHSGSPPAAETRTFLSKIQVYLL